MYVVEIEMYASALLYSCCDVKAKETRKSGANEYLGNTKVHVLTLVWAHLP